MDEAQSSITDGEVNGVSFSITDEAVVILKSNPLELPMVCGLCGCQYATARELENHMNIHRAGGTIKRGRGRPKGSKSKKPATESAVLNTDSTNQPGNDVTSEQSEPSTSATETRRSQRVVKKPNTDLYVQGEEEIDNLLSDTEEGLVPYSKGSLPQFTAQGVPIARVEDYILDRDTHSATNNVVIRQGQNDLERLDINDLAHGGLNIMSDNMTTQEENASGQPATTDTQTDTSMHVLTGVGQTVTEGQNICDTSKQVDVVVSSSAPDDSNTITLSLEMNSEDKLKQALHEMVNNPLHTSSVSDPVSSLIITESGEVTADSAGVDAALQQSAGDDGVTHIEVCLFDPSEDISSLDQQKKHTMCELCCLILPAVEMREHMMTVHMDNSTQEFVCPKHDCGRAFSTIPQLRLHIVEAHTAADSSAAGLTDNRLPKVYSCEDCEAVCETKELLRDHVQMAHNKELTVIPRPTRAVSCDICQRICMSKQALKLHVANDHKESGEIACEVCHKVFKSKRAQSSHMKAHTKGYDPVSCQKCGKEFKHPSALKFHVTMMPECNKPKYVCEICGYKAPTPWRLHSHKIQVHSNERPYQCQICHKKYKTNEMLKQHTYKLHTGTPRFECDVCQRKFFYAAELREHKQLHSTTKEFVCPICNRAFKTMHVFRGHMNGKHSDTWYSCGFCKFTTSHKKSMKRHMVLVHKLKNVTLEVTPEESPPSQGVIPQQVEIIQSDDLTGLQLSDNVQVIDTMQHVQYEDVGVMSPDTEHHISGVIAQHHTTISANEVLTQHGEVLTQEMDEESIRQLISQHQQSVDGSMNASEVSQVLVSLSGAVVTEDGVVEHNADSIGTTSHSMVETDGDIGTELASVIVSAS